MYFFCFHVCCSVSLCIHYITLASLKLFTRSQALILWKIDGKQDPNPSFLLQTFWLCYFKVNSSVLEYFLWLVYGTRTQLRNIKLMMAVRKHEHLHCYVFSCTLSTSGTSEWSVPICGLCTPFITSFYLLYH